MISESETNTYENLERAIVKRLIINLNKIARQKRQQAKTLNATEILKLNEIMSIKFYKIEDATRLTTEYLNFLIRFYEDKNKEQAREYIKRFLSVFDKTFKDLDITSVYRNYRKLIHSRISDYDTSDDREDTEYYEDCAVNSHLLYSGSNIFHYI